MSSLHRSSTVAAMREWGGDVLRRARITSATLDTDVLLAHVMRKDRAFLLSHPEGVVMPRIERLFRTLVQKRLRGEPVAYLIGTKEFYGREFIVNRHVLIPRPKTEDMVERAKEVLSGWNLAETLVIDVGTGSGILAITIKELFPRVSVLAIDHSRRALKVAMDNARRHGFDQVGFGLWLIDLRQKAIHFLHSDLLSAVVSFPFQNVLILANLPYVPTNEIATLEKDVKDFEPTKALDGGGDGLCLFRRMARQVHRKFPGKNVRVVWECEDEQETEVARMFSDFT